MTVITVSEFAKSKSFVHITPVVRENTNKYPFITFIDGDNKAENVYFSKAAAANVAAGTPVTKEMLKTMQIAMVTNEAGEPRVKIVSNSQRVALADLLD